MSQQGNQPLPSKEANYLRQVIKFYEQKQYKKGLKTADQILRKFPDHGETLALKGLILNCLERKTEAYEHVSRGIRSDMKSHVCWHVNGLLYRSDRDYKKAISCYTNALKHDKDNIQILRDLALLQIQMRDLGGFLDTRYHLLQLRPGNRNNWIGFCAGHYLNCNYEVAVQVLSSYESTLEEIPKEEAYEHSELLMFKTKILEEMEKYNEALETLHSSKSMIKDKIAFIETEARIYTKLDKTEEATDRYKCLLDIIPDNFEYHKNLQDALTMSTEKEDATSSELQEKLDEFYKDFQEKYPRCLASKRIRLDYRQGTEFLKAAELYIQDFLVKGIPSLFSDLKPLYKDPAKVETLFQIFEKYIEGVSKGETADFVEAELNAQCYVWIHHYLAQHYDQVGKFELALQHVKLALDHTPTIAETYVVYSRILKHLGDLPGAFEAANQGRQLDLADRYLNCIAVKAAFRAGLIQEADDLAALFTKDEIQIANLVEMQCLWYEIASGNAHLRKQNYGKALKKFVAVNKHFEDFVEDQFDFHGYCVRKMTLRAYIDMLNMEDKIYRERSFAKAAVGAIQCYLAAYDNEHIRQNPNQDSEMKESENQKKDKKKETSTHKKGQPPPAKADPDPNGVQLVSIETPLEEATKFVTMLRTHAGDRLDSHETGFEVYLRKKKMLLALSCVQRACDIVRRSHPSVHSMIVRLCKTVEEVDVPEVPNAATSVLDEGISALLDEKQSLSEYNELYFQKDASTSIVHRAVAVEMFIYLDPAQKDHYLSLLMEGDGPLGGGFRSEHVSLKDCQRVHEMLLGNILKSATVAVDWKNRCAKLFPRSSYFGGVDCSTLKTRVIAASMPITTTTITTTITTTTTTTLLSNENGISTTNIKSETNENVESSSIVQD